MEYRYDSYDGYDSSCEYCPYQDFCDPVLEPLCLDPSLDDGHPDDFGDF